ncbi:hypothetical protein CRUP_017184 [Coryphaenoides rupestris]|nr:hypothetical protein CRUP_017184 [Coryphaenoides rupestris]
MLFCVRKTANSLCSQRTPISHKVIEKRRRDRINRCLSELGKTVPMALAKQSSGKLEKAEILEMTVQYLRALHSAEFPRGREKGELLAEFANYFHFGYHECMKNLVHYLSTEDRTETRDIKYARILAFLQSRSRAVTDPVFGPPLQTDSIYHQHQSPPPPPPPPPGHFSWASPTPLAYQPLGGLSGPLGGHSGPGGQQQQQQQQLQLQQQHHVGAGGYLQAGLDHHHHHHYFNLLSHTHANAFTLQGAAQHAM